MINTIVKRDGRVEDFCPSKLVEWAEWASVVGADWSGILKDTLNKVKDGCTSEQLHQALIKSCLDKEDEPHSKMAGRLYIGGVYKQCFGSIHAIPSLTEYYREMVSLGFMEDMNYSGEELEYFDSFLNHDEDLEMSYPQARQIVNKYSLRNKVTNQLFETPQFSFMRMALGSCKDSLCQERGIDIPNFFEQYKGAVNCTTPDWNNLGTFNRGYASCCLFTAADNTGSLNTRDHIAYHMTVASAGLGSMLLTRSAKDPIRGGVIEHNGKLPYLRLARENSRANKQGARSGAETQSVCALDPEIMTLLDCRNPKTVESKKIDGIDYSFSTNSYFDRKAAEDGDWMLISIYYAPDLWEAFFDSDTIVFENLYNRYLQDDNVPKTIVKARDVLFKHLINTQEVGRQYHTDITEINYHTPLKETIHHSNLCVSPETLILTKSGYTAISELEGETLDTWNGEEWSSVDVVKTGENQKLLHVTTSAGHTLDCTEYHKWYVFDGYGKPCIEKRTNELLEGDKLIKFDLPLIEGDEDLYLAYVNISSFNKIVSVVDEGRVDDTYCFTEKKRGMGMFNGILTGQCQEIMEHTRPYNNVGELSVYGEVTGEIALCSLSAIIPDHLKLEVVNGKFTEGSIERYEESCYYALKKIDNTIEMMDYPFKNLEYTAKRRRYAAVGLSGLAYEMALKGFKYTSDEGKRYLHMLSELHMFSLIRASLTLSKERGVCEWMDRTKWVDGWMPIDTYNKNIDNYVDSTLNLDWETLRKQVIDNGGHRFSLLCAHMPTESSSIASNRPNSVYPIRSHVLIKGDGDDAKVFIAPEAERLKDDYQIAWDIPTKDMLNVYGILQKFCDQGISVDTWIHRDNHQTVTPRFSMKGMMEDYFHARSIGIKSRYYTNSKNSGDRDDGKEIISDNNSCTGGACEV